MHRLHKILVLSDSHGAAAPLFKAAKLHNDADIIIHCGDSNNEVDALIEKYPDKTFYTVRGNCDFMSSFPDKIITEIGGYRFFITHGHLYNAKWTIRDLIYAAQENNSDFLIYGHTHTELNEYYDGMYIMNPGSVGYSKTYGIIEITDKGILTNIGKL